jgi:hypothetical protein
MNACDSMFVMSCPGKERLSIGTYEPVFSIFYENVY